jgi:hypothetical protein
MKKVMLFALSVMMMAGASIFAQDVVKSAKDSTATTVTTTTTKAEPVKTAIKTAELPKPVTDLITSFKAQGWEASENSSSVKQGTADFYEVTFKKTASGETKSIYIDAQGKIVNQ